MLQKDLKELPMKEFSSTLKVHEIKLKDGEKETPKGSLSKAFKAEKSFYKASKGEGSNEDDLSFISRKIHSMWKKKGGSRWNNYSKKFFNETKDKSLVVCYGCKKFRHLKSECSNLEKVKKKSFFNKKKKVLKRENEVQSEENKKLQEEKPINSLGVKPSKEVEQLQKEVIGLRESLLKFVNGFEYLDKILRTKRNPNDKSSIGYVKKRSTKTIAKNSSSHYNASNTFSTDKRRHKSVLVFKNMIIHVVDLLNIRKNTTIIVLGQ
ncbi:hypothetical protein CR513_19812, partial [Mucuna pruriens]